MVEAGADGAQLVVKRIDECVLLFTDVTSLRSGEFARERRVGRPADVDAAGFVIDAIGRAGGSGLDDSPVSPRHFGAFCKSTVHFDGPEHVRGRMTHRDEVRVLVVEGVQTVQHSQRRRKVIRVKLRASGLVEGHTTAYRAALTRPGARLPDCGAEKRADAECDCKSKSAADEYSKRWPQGGAAAQLCAERTGDTQRDEGRGECDRNPKLRGR